MHLKIGDRKVRFMLDCGAMVNLLLEALVRSIVRINDVHPLTTALRMLKDTGMITATIQHPHMLRS